MQVQNISLYTAWVRMAINQISLYIIRNYFIGFLIMYAYPMLYLNTTGFSVELTDLPSKVWLNTIFKDIATVYKTTADAAFGKKKSQ